MPQFTERYKQFAAERGFFVAQLAIDFQSFQRDASQGMRDPEIVMLLDTIRAARNPVLMRMLAERVAPARVKTADAVGWAADSLEAQGFAYLAVRSLNGLPLSFPATTGVPQPMTGGKLHACS